MYVLLRSFLVAALGVMLLAPAARADSVLGGVTSSDCNQDVSRPFVPWGDSALYFLAPNGDFSAGADGWHGGAVVGDSSPLSGGGALSLGDGDRATSPGVC